MNYIKSFITAAMVIFAFNAWSHHLAPEEMQEFITDKLEAVFNVKNTGDEPL